MSKIISVIGTCLLMAACAGVPSCPSEPCPQQLWHIHKDKVIGNSCDNGCAPYTCIAAYDPVAEAATFCNTPGDLLCVCGPVDLEALR